MPTNHKVTIFTQYTINEVIFTFRKPLFFTKIKENIQNKDLFLAVLHYQFNVVINSNIEKKQSILRVR